MREVNVKLDAFEGPLDLLYHLIEKNEIDIYDIPIAQLTQQYISFLSESREAEMESMSSFLVMASTLLEIKSKMLLPSKTDDQQEEDPRERLVRQLLEYKIFKAAGLALTENEEKTEGMFFRQGLPNPEPETTNNLDNMLFGITLDSLYKVFQDVLNRKEIKTDKIRASFGTVKRDLYNVKDKMTHIENLLLLRGNINFRDAFRNDAHKIEKIVTFLAVLELIKLKRITIIQNNNFEEILISRGEKHQV